MADLATIARYSDSALWDATIPELPNHYAGKVRDNYDLPDGRRILVASDRLSAFDMVLTALPLKGQVLTQIARFWFDKTADICKNHVIEYPDPNVVVGQRLAMLPVEIVVRDYLAGTTSTSVWSMYKAGKREMYGIRLPDGLRENQKLPETIITPTTKGEEGAHDEPLAPADIVGRGLLPKAQWDEVTHHALALFARGRELARARGLILVDTKYEFGVDPSGHVVLADEIHTPDSSRYWYLASYEEQFRKGERPLSFDKDVVRNWVAARCDPYKEKVPEIPKDVIVGAAKVYVDVCETITGGFSWPDRGVAPLQRIRTNLKKYF